MFGADTKSQSNDYVVVFVGDSSTYYLYAFVVTLLAA